MLGHPDVENLRDPLLKQFLHMQFQKATKTEAKERDSDLVRALKLLMDTIPSIVGKARVSDKHAALPMSLLQSLAFPSALKGRQIDRTHTGAHTHTHTYT
jgi:hypothetical protein